MITEPDNRHGVKEAAIRRPLSLREARKLTGLNQTVISLRIGISQQHYSELERGLPLTPAEHIALLGVLRAAGLTGLIATDLVCGVRHQRAPESEEQSA